MPTSLTKGGAGLTAAMRIGWVGAFDPLFSRNRKLSRLFELAGIEVDIIRETLWAPDRLVVARRGKLHVLWRGLLSYPRLVLRIIRAAPPDIYFVSYPGWFDVPIVATIAKLRNRPLVFDPFISLYDTLVEDRGMFSSASIIGKLALWIDRLSLRMTNCVIADTPAHLSMYDRMSPGTKDKGAVMAVGADDSVFGPLASAVDDHLVFFHGSFVPLQGVETIIDAAHLVKDEGIRFRVVGNGQTRAAIERRALDLSANNVEFMDSVALEMLPRLIAEAGVCLGIFGTSGKAGRVIPHKLYEYLAVGRPVITRDSEALRRLFHDGEVVTVPPGDPAALAQAIRLLLAEETTREATALAGAKAYRTRFHERVLAARLKEIIASVASAEERPRRTVDTER